MLVATATCDFSWSISRAMFAFVRRNCSDSAFSCFIKRTLCCFIALTHAHTHTIIHTVHHRHTLGLADNRSLIISQTRTNFSNRAIGAGQQHWNDLPPDLKTAGLTENGSGATSQYESVMNRNTHLFTSLHMHQTTHRWMHHQALQWN